MTVEGMLRKLGFVFEKDKREFNVDFPENKPEKSVKIKIGQQTTLVIRHIIEIPKPIFWKCAYCETQNEIKEERCLNCGSPRRV